MYVADIIMKGSESRGRDVSTIL